MKPQTKYFLAIIPLLIGASVPVAIQASNANSGTQPLGRELLAHKFGKGRSEKFLESLNLTDAQRSQIDAIHSRNSDEAESLWSELKAEKESMKNLVASSAPADELRQQHAKIQTLKTNMGTRRFEKMLEVYEILTPEQRKAFAEKMGRHGGRRGRHHHKQNKPEAQKQTLLMHF